MRYTRPVTLLIALFFLSACALFEAKQPPPPPVTPQQLTVPVGKNWKVVEEAPALTSERSDQRLSFQGEQSLQPEGAQRPAPPAEKGRTIETTR